MLASSIPSRFSIAFGTSAPGGNIRTVPDTTADPTAASLTLGFPTATLTPISGGGAPPDGRDFNGIFLQITQWSQWQAAGGPVGYDATFSAAIGGYPAGAVLAASGIVGGFWISLVDSNTSNPDASGANWLFYSTLGFQAGDAKLTLSTTADTGWVLCNDGSLSNAGNGGTTRANLDTLNLFTKLWNNVSNTYAPVQDNTGVAVARGASATADFTTNNRRIVMTAVLGRALIIAGAGSGLTSRALGQTLGEETHLQTLAELVSHAHSTHSTTFQAGGNATGCDTGSGTLTTGSTGGGTAFNVMQPSSAWNLMVRL